MFQGLSISFLDSYIIVEFMIFFYLIDWKSFYLSFLKHFFMRLSNYPNLKAVI